MTRTRRRVVAGVGVAAFTVGSVALVMWLVSGDARPLLSATDAAATYTYVIPEGTGARLDAGERVEVLPDTLRARVGEVLRIRNDDRRGHVVGPFYVAADQTLTQRLDSPGVLVGACSAHPDGRFRLEVST